MFTVEGSNEPISEPMGLDLPVVEPAAPEPPPARPAEAVERLLADVPPPPPVSAPEPEPWQPEPAPAELEAAKTILEPPRLEEPIAPAPEPMVARTEPIEPAVVEAVRKTPLEKTAPAEPPPSFSSAASEDAPSKFAAEDEPVVTPKRKFPALLVIAFVALLVGAAVIVYLQRKDKSPTAPTSKPDTTTTTTTATTTTATTPTASATQSTSAAAPVTSETVAPATSDAPSASASVSSAPAVGPDDPPSDPAALPETKAFLFVAFEGDGEVFTSNGAKLGKVNTWLEVTCNARGAYIAVAKAGMAAPGGGRSQPIPCRKATKITVLPAELNPRVPNRLPPPPGGGDTPPPPPAPPVNPQEP